MFSSFIIWSLVIFLAAAIVLWLFARLTCGQCECARSHAFGKTILITGVKRGIGKSCSEELVKGGANLIIGCRDTNKAEMLRMDCVRRNYQGSIRVLQLDLLSFKSVLEFVEEVKSVTSKIVLKDVLINNAGVGVPEKITKTEDGFEATYQTNYLSPVLLTHSLLPLISRPGRIVNVSSLQHLVASNSRVARSELCSPSIPLFGSFVYGDTKLAMNYWTKTLASRLSEAGIAVNCCHPGFVNTEIFFNTHGNFAQFTLGLLAHIYAKNPLEGAQTVLHLVLSKEAADISGKYWADCAVVRYSRRAYRKSTAAALRRNTLTQLGLEDVWSCAQSHNCIPFLADFIMNLTLRPNPLILKGLFTKQTSLVQTCSWILHNELQ